MPRPAAAKPKLTLRPTQLGALPNELYEDKTTLPVDYQPPPLAAEIVTEWRNLGKLLKGGAYPTQSVLLHGPTGTGKSTAARAMRDALGLPLVSMLLSTTIGSHLGETGSSLDRAMRYAMDTKCILLMDEVDSICIGRKIGRSGGDSASGEMYRVTNTFIQLLDRWHEESRGSILIGTTNMFQNIDTAIRRRFEVDIDIPMPSAKELSIMAGCILPADLSMSFGQLKRLVLQAKRRSIIEGVDYGMHLLSLIDQYLKHGDVKKYETRAA